MQLIKITKEQNIRNRFSFISKKVCIVLISV